MTYITFGKKIIYTNFLLREMIKILVEMQVIKMRIMEMRIIKVRIIKILLLVILAKIKIIVIEQSN